MLSTMTFRAKQFACFGFILGLAAVASVESLYTMRRLRRELDTAIELRSFRLDQSRQIALSTAEMRSATRGITLFALRNNQAGLARAQAGFEASARKMQDIVNAMAAGQLSGPEAAAVDTIRSALEQWMQAYPQFVGLCVSGRAEEADAIALQRMSPVMDAIQKSAADFGQANVAWRDRAVAQFQASIDHSTGVTVVMNLLLMLAAGAALIVVLHLNKILRGITDSVQAGASQIARASAQVSSASQSLAQGSSTQAASLEETSASTQEIGVAAQKNREGSEAADSLVVQSGEQFDKANQNLESMVQAMSEISASSHNISRIIKVIDEIAFQTNILALNAAVEAARAGEAGAGFAVVADEVRNLAQRCAQAAQDTSASIEESIAKSAEGKERVDQVALSIRLATQQALGVKGLISEVNRGSQEQAHGIQEIGRAMAQMEQITQKNAANAEDTAAAAEELMAQSGSLQDLVGQLTALVGRTTN